MKELLDDFLERNRRRAFVWGEWDCLNMAREWADEAAPGLAGPLADFMERERYFDRVKSEDDFKRFLVEQRLVSPIRFAALGRRLGYVLREDAAQVGDVVLDANLNYGICCEAGEAAMFLCMSGEGFRRVEGISGMVAWAVEA